MSKEGAVMSRIINKSITCAVILFTVIFASMLFLVQTDSVYAARDVEWGSYQNSVDNNGVTDRSTPESYNDTALKWGRQLVSGYTTSFTPPLIIDGYIYTASREKVYKLSKETGEILAESEKMEIDVSYAMHPMTYSSKEDALYLPLLRGRVQCIDPGTLQLKWISKAYPGSQALSPITYSDGRVYTGIWTKETADGAYFCLDAKTGKTIWTLRPSELRTVTKAEELDTFQVPVGFDAPENYYKYTALITVKPKSGYKFECDRFGKCWICDSTGKKLLPAGTTESTAVPCTVNGLSADIEYSDDGSGQAVVRAGFDYYQGHFTQQGSAQKGASVISGLDVPTVGALLDTDVNTSEYFDVLNIEWKEGDIPHGFYWAGCYVNDRYVVFGSDDGQNNTFGAAGDATYTSTSILYSCDKKTGEIIDKIDGCKGDIRSTVVHHNGYIYFTSKGGVLHKVKLGSDGKFSDLSSFDTGALMTASPVVHNGRIYVGVCGMAGQFNADGGHKFCVFSDDEKLTGQAIYDEKIVGKRRIKVMKDGTGSFRYCVDIAGYPQAAPVLSTYSEKSGVVRLYFTFNAFPGGIYYLEDTPSANQSNHKEAELLFRPESEMEQYCISPIAVDKEGTLYIKNDSGYMMAVANNKAWLNDIKVTAGDDEVEWNIDFRQGTLKYTLIAPNDAQSVNFELDVPEGMTAYINGKEYKGGKVAVPVTEESAATTVVVKKTVGKENYTRTYTLNMKTSSNDANLKGIIITDTNTPPSGSEGLGMDPEFSPDTVKYVSRRYDGSKEFINVWITKSDSRSTIKVWPVDHVGNDLVYTNPDGTLPDKGMNGNLRYPVYWIKGQISAEVRVEVTSASGKVVKSYDIELVRTERNLDIGKEPLYVEPATCELYTEGGNKTRQAKATYGGKDVTADCVWTSSRPSKVTVDSTGMIAAQGSEVASDNPISIWARYGAQERPVSVSVVKPLCARPLANIENGTYLKKRNIVLTSSTPGAKVYYNIGDPNEEAVEIPTEESTLYESPIVLGEEGEVKQYLIRAAAFNSIGAKSEVMDYLYTIDLTGEPEDPAGRFVLDTSDGTGLTVSSDSITDLPNGISVEEIRDRLSSLTVMAKSTDGRTMSLGAESVFWDEDVIITRYDPSDLCPVAFGAEGKVTLPDSIDPDGSSRDVSVVVTVQEGKVSKPVFKPSAGKYKEPQYVTMSSATPGAAVFYTMSGSDKTKVYEDPVAVTGKAGKKTAVAFKAYAMAQGLKSKTVSYTIIIDRTGENPAAAKKYKVKGLKITSAKRKFTVKWKKTLYATGYQVQYKLKGAKKWSSLKKTTTLEVRSKAMKKGAKYQFRVRTYTKLSGKTYYGKWTAAKTAKCS
ncbi:MAG: chitobiase/beta-hexosaminidase C-terminal domain-containing protein [Eubacterium sp.]|nr:chitobiase/beta-hexosaminidase C-terminal domain-containing protein [Eubacterium sp.]